MAGRPKTHIDWPEFEKLCEIQCTVEEIAFWYRCSVLTIMRAVKRQYKADFDTVRQQKAMRGKVAVRRSLMQLVLKGNLGAIIWASKNYMGMSDKLDQNINNTGSAPQIIVSLPDNGYSVMERNAEMSPAELVSDEEPIKEKEADAHTV